MRNTEAQNAVHPAMRAVLWSLPGLLLATPPAISADPSRGQALYQSYCMVCHSFPPVGGPEIVLHEVPRLREISVVTWPADPDTTIAVRDLRQPAALAAA